MGHSNGRPTDKPVPARLVVNLVVNLIVNLIVNLVVNTLSSKRLDAKRHYVILAKALDGIWPVGHACAVLC